MTRKAIGVTTIKTNNQIGRFDIEQVTGPLSIDGYCPLYTTSRAAVAASPFPDMIRLNEKTVGYHIHVLDGTTYYMPNGLKMGETQFHGDCPGIVPQPELDDGGGTEVDPNRPPPIITVAGGKIQFPYKPSLVQNGSDFHMWYFIQRVEWRDRGKDGMYTGTGMAFWEAETDEDYREWVREHLSQPSPFTINDKTTVEDWIEVFGEDPTVVRNTYLNENTTGWILLDFEAPRNLGNLLDISQSDLRKFVEGLIRRINILREFMPNAKFGLWRFGDGHNPRFDSSVDIKKYRDRQVFASKIEYQGKTLFDSLDFLSPTLYQYKVYENTDAYSRIINGTRVYRSKDVCDSIFEEHGEVKPVVPIISNIYFGDTDNDDDSVIGDELAYKLNAIEINYWEEEDYTSHYAYWFPYTQDLYDYYYARNLLVRYYGESYVFNSDTSTSIPVEPSLESY